jgi:hypothetical protein
MFVGRRRKAQLSEAFPRKKILERYPEMIVCSGGRR